MTSLQETKDQVAQEAHWLNWDEATKFIPCSEIHHLSDKVAQRYAIQYAEEDRKDCAEKARAESAPFHGCQVDKSSILDRPYPEMK